MTGIRRIAICHAFMALALCGAAQAKTIVFIGNSFTFGANSAAHYYKSDTVTGNRNELVTFYSRQIELYRRYWERLTGRSTKAGLFFVQTGEEWWLDPA